jgi:hypothetical protein
MSKTENPNNTSQDLNKSILNVLNHDNSIVDVESFSVLENAANSIGIQCIQYQILADMFLDYLRRVKVCETEIVYNAKENF